MDAKIPRFLREESQLLERAQNVELGKQFAGLAMESRALMIFFSRIDVPVRLNGVDQEIWVRPGDIIIGDADGVVCLPRSLAARVVGIAAQLVSG